MPTAATTAPNTTLPTNHASKYSTTFAIVISCGPKVSGFPENSQLPSTSPPYTMNGASGGMEMLLAKSVVALFNRNQRHVSPRRSRQALQLKRIPLRAHTQFQRGRQRITPKPTLRVAEPHVGRHAKPKTGNPIRPPPPRRRARRHKITHAYKQRLRLPLRRRQKFWHIFREMLPVRV